MRCCPIIDYRSTRLCITGFVHYHQPIQCGRGRLRLGEVPCSKVAHVRLTSTAMSLEDLANAEKTAKAALLAQRASTRKWKAEGSPMTGELYITTMQLLIESMRL